MGLVVSIVSHGHGLQVQALLDELAAMAASSVTRIVLTLNVPEAAPVPPATGWPFALQVRRNPAALGFGANHNRALAGAVEPHVCVLNPDVSLAGADPFGALLQAASAPGVGCAYPAQVDSRGKLQDFERALPTPAALFRRRGLGRPETRVDWVNAACLVMPRAAWEAVGGFDERYFMYCEDVDLCLRLRRAGWSLQRAAASVVHAGERASHRRLRHLGWHVSSLLRLWRSDPYRWARAALAVPDRAAGNISAP